jgi:NAD(P)H dehydrogenase (quinone)
VTHVLTDPWPHIGRVYDEWPERDLQALGRLPHVHDHIATMARLHGQGRYDRASSDISDLLGRAPSGFGDAGD